MKFMLDKNWQPIIGAELETPAMKKLQDFLKIEHASKKIIYPQHNEIFAALTLTPFEKIKIVILGQDPYHGPGQAHGLAFSVREGVKLPPSLRNIYKEIESEYDVKMPKSGDLTRWAQQGVLLLNATLTVREAAAGSHQKKGWENFTDAIIKSINEKHDHIVFMLWGSYAQKKGEFIDRTKHLVLEAPHPSPLSAHRGFLGCGHFKKANAYLSSAGKTPINWS
jgi:uracil-DNA glycosylase